MRILLDTNVLLAAFISHGTCAQILEYCVRQHDLVSSDFILDELQRNLREKFGHSSREARQVCELLRSRMEIVQPHDLGKRVCRDPEDDPILGTALAGRCLCIITGDKDLLSLEKWRGIAMIHPSDFWRREAARQKAD